jgi:hypothetical protein
MNNLLTNTVPMWAGERLEIAMVAVIIVTAIIIGFYTILRRHQSYTHTIPRKTWVGIGWYLTGVATSLVIMAALSIISIFLK